MLRKVVKAILHLLCQLWCIFSIFLSEEKMYAVMWDIFSSSSGLYLIYRVTILLKSTRWWWQFLLAKYKILYCGNSPTSCRGRIKELLWDLLAFVPMEDFQAPWIHRVQTYWQMCGDLVGTLIGKERLSNFFFNRANSCLKLSEVSVN